MILHYTRLYVSTWRQVVIFVLLCLLRALSMEQLDLLSLIGRELVLPKGRRRIPSRTLLTVKSRSRNIRLERFHLFLLISRFRGQLLGLHIAMITCGEF